MRGPAGPAPGDRPVVPDQHPGHAGLGVAGDVVRAGRPDLGAVQPHLVPRGRQARRRDRGRGQQRGAARGQPAGDRPRVETGVRAVLRVERLDLGAREAAGQERAGDLLADGAVRVPGGGLEPAERVDGRPLGRHVARGGVRVGHSEHRVLEGERLAARMRGQVVVHPPREGLQIRLRLRLQQVVGPRGDRPPAERAGELVVRERVRAEQRGQRARRVVPGDVHLPEPVLRLHVALGEEQVGGVRGVDLRDARGVPVHRRRPGQARDPQRARGLRIGGVQRLAQPPAAESGHRRQRQHEHHGAHGERAPQPSPPAGRRGCCGRDPAGGRGRRRQGSLLTVRRRGSDRASPWWACTFSPARSLTPTLPHAPANARALLLSTRR